MITRFLHLLGLLLFLIPAIAGAQNFSKIIYDRKDTLNDYYIAVPPVSGTVNAAVVLFTSFGKPENILSETKLQNVASANNMLTVFASLNNSLCADSATLLNIEKIIKNVTSVYKVDTSHIVLGGYIYAGNIILRYTELSYQFPSEYGVRPKAVLAINCPVDLVELTRICEREIQKNYIPVSVNESSFILKTLADECGPVNGNIDNYISLSPFYYNSLSSGNERFLQNVAVRLYYDTDINWELKNRRDGYYDTYLPGGSELIKRLLLMGNTKAEFVESKNPGIRSNGLRNPSSWSVVDEVECIQWVKKQLNIFDPVNYDPEYRLAIPAGWNIERIPFPIDFAPGIQYSGIEDIRFSPKFWVDPESNQYWSYAYLWWLKGNPDITASGLEQNLENYYSGLVNRNIPARNIPADKVVPTTASVKKIKTDPGDLETYSGKVSTLDYIAQKPIILNVVIHKKICVNQNHVALFFEVSPAPAVNNIWQDLNNLWSTFGCSH